MSTVAEDLRIIRPKQLAEQFGVSLMTLWRWETRGFLPKKVRLGPNTRGYRRSDIEAFLDRRAAEEAP